jgi:HTTM domain
VIGGEREVGTAHPTMNVAPWSLKTTASAFARAWNSFFHTPCDARIPAAIRIAYATLVLIHFSVLYPDLDLWFTGTGVLPVEASPKVTSPYAWSLLRLLPDTSATVHACFWLAAAHAVMLLVGLLPRVNAFFLFLWLISFQFRNDVINDGEDCLMRVLGFFVIWLPSGRCWSVNAVVRKWWRNIRGQRSEIGDQSAAGTARPTVPGWVVRLMQIEMSAMFFSSALMKLAGEPWVNGTALYYVSRLDDFFGRFPVPAFLFDTPWTVAVMTWSVVLAEFSIPILIWFKETRRPCLLVLLAFHLANEWTMNLFLFHYLMLCGWISFVTPEDFAWLAHWGNRRPRMNTDDTDSGQPVAREVAELSAG